MYLGIDASIAVQVLDVGSLTASLGLWSWAPGFGKMAKCMYLGIYVFSKIAQFGISNFGAQDHAHQCENLDLGVPVLTFEA